MKNFGNTSRGRSQGVPKFFRAPTYTFRRHFCDRKDRFHMKFLTDFTCRNLHGFARFPGDSTAVVSFYQRVSIASYASAGIAREGMSVRLSARPSVTLRYCIKTKKASVMISSPSENRNILVSRNIWFITKFDRGHPERARLQRLGWVQTGDFFDQ